MGGPSALLKYGFSDAKYFDNGLALHGDSYVPPVPVSHGFVRVSDEAVDWTCPTGWHR